MELLGVFVKTPFRNYNKSKEFLSGHEEKKYHKICIERAGIIRGQIGSVESRIDIQINQKAVQMPEEMNRYFHLSSTW